MNKFPQKRVYQGQMLSLLSLTKHLRKKLYQFSAILSWKQERTFPNSFYYQDIDIRLRRTKKKHKPVLLVNTDAMNCWQIESNYV